MLGFDLKNGKLTIELDEPIKYAKDGKYVEGKSVICFEPVQSSSLDCMRLAQMLNKIEIQTFKNFFGDKKFEDEGNKEKPVGEEIIPFYKQKQPKLKDLIEGAKGVAGMLLSSDLDPADFLNAGKTILTTRYSSKDRRRLCVMNDESETAVTKEMFDDMTIEDRLFIIGAFSTFFGIGLTGQKKNTSVKR